MAHFRISGGDDSVFGDSLSDSGSAFFIFLDILGNDFRQKIGTFFELSIDILSIKIKMGQYFSYIRDEDREELSSLFSVVPVDFGPESFLP